MHLETRVEVLRGYSNDEWQHLLKLTLHHRGPVRLIFVRDAVEDRRAFIEQRLSEGATRAAIAGELEVSPSLITKILKGDRR